jgi:hypothetical protein
MWNKKRARISKTKGQELKEDLREEADKDV